MQTGIRGKGAVRHQVSVGGMAEAGYGMETLERIRAEGLGDYVVLFVGAWSLELLRDVVAFCKQHKMRFVMDEMWRRTQPGPRPGYAEIDEDAFRALITEAGDCFDGSLFMCEYGGLAAYWPASTVEGSPNVIPPTPCAAEAKAHMIAKLRELSAMATAWLVPRPLVLIEASPMAKYLYEAGIDRVDLEITYNRFTELGYSATRGATRAYGKTRFGTDMAMVWYGGNQHDPLWRHRWKVSLYHAFLRGADPIYAEHGVMDYQARGKTCETDSPEVQMFRAELAAFATFCKAHPRPTGFPKTRVAVIHGNLDSFAENTIGQPYVWGQRGKDERRSGYPEQAWDVFSTLYQNKYWEFPCADGDRDLSGNPPWGQVDVIPAESDVSIWQQYTGIVFLGWNTMTPEIYRTMEAYVDGGGHVLASLVHLDTRTRRDAAPEFIHGGDLHELFGVRVLGLDARVGEGVKFKQQPSRGAYRFPAWTDRGDPMYQQGGFPCARLERTTAELIAVGSDRFTDTWTEMDHNPVLTANAHGKGMAFLLNTLEYAGHPGLRQLTTDLLYFFFNAWQGELRVEASDRIRYGVFEEGDMQILYVLNADPSLTQEVRVSYSAVDRAAFSVAPGALRVVYMNDGGMVAPEDPAVRVIDLGWDGARPRLQFYAEGCSLDEMDVVTVYESHQIS